MALVVSFMASSASGQGILFGVSGPENALYSINTETGAATLIGGTGVTPPPGTSGPPTALASDPLTGAVWAMFNGSNTLYSLNLGTGTATEFLTLNLDSLELTATSLLNVGLTYDPAQTLFYVSDLDSDSLYSFGLDG